MVYNKNKWFLVEEWRNVDKQEALNRAAEIMIEDFQIAGDQYWNMWRQLIERLDHMEVGM